MSRITNSPRPTAIDLFAGAGGLTQGLKGAGFDVRSAVEFDATAAESYSLNHPSVKLIHADIRRVSGVELSAAANVPRGELALLSGCPPCQGFSTLRTRKTGVADDPRNDLIFEILRLVRSLRPKAVLMENVPGLASQTRFERFRDGLSRAGYGHDVSIVNASWFGVPQRRQRLVLLGLRNGIPPQGWCDPTGIRRTVRDAIACLRKAGESGDPLHDLPERRSLLVMERIAKIPKDGGSRGGLPKEIQLECHNRSNGFHDVYGRLAWDDIAPTITSGCINPSKGRFLHPTEDRAITLREAALLQTFPPEYQFSLSRGKEHAALQIGNAFPPDLIRPIALRVLREIRP